MVRQEPKLDRESDSDAVVPNSEDELTVADIQELLSSRHVMKRRRLMNTSQLTDTSIVKINNDESLSEISVQIDEPTDNKIGNKSQLTTENLKQNSKKKARQQPLRRSTRKNTDDVTYHYLPNMSDSDREIDPFDCGNDDSENDPSFKDEPFEAKAGKKPKEKPEKKKEKNTVIKKVKPAANIIKIDMKKEKSKIQVQNKKKEEGK